MASAKANAARAKFKKDYESGKLKVNKGEIITPGKIIIAAKGLTKAARTARDKEIIKRSPDLKDTPNLTLRQAKRMKEGTKSLAKTTKSIAKSSSKKGSYGATTIGDANAFKIKMGIDKPSGGSEVKGFPSLSTPSLGGLHKGPSNMTLGQMDRLSAIRESEKAKAYAAAYRQAKRETKDMKKSMQSNANKTVKKVAISGAASIPAAIAANTYISSKNKPPVKKKK